MIINNTTLTLKMKRAISELRSGGKVVISDNSFGTSILLMSAELIEKESVNKLSDLALSRPNIILSRNRCNAIGIEVSNQPCSILIDKHWTLNILTWLSLGYSMFGVNQQGSKKSGKIDNLNKHFFSF